MGTEKGLISREKAPVRLVILLQDLEFGGTQRYAVSLLEHMNRDIFSPELWLLCNRPDLVPLARDLGTKTRLLSAAFHVLPHALVKLTGLLFLHRPRILYTLTPVPNIWGRIFGGLFRVPAIVSSYRSGRPGQYESLLWPLSSRIISNAEAAKREIIRRHSVPADRVAVVPNAVDTAFWSPDRSLKAAAPTVVYVGRLIESKDVLTLLEGFRLTANRFPGARLEILGNGPLKARLEAFARRQGLESRVTFTPGQLDPRPALRRAWVFATASRREAAPNAVLEAMAMGLPVVAAGVGGVPELVRHGETGFVIRPGDPEGLAGGLTLLLKDEQRRLQMAKKARERILTHHTVVEMVRRTERVLIDALGEAALSGQGWGPAARVQDEPRPSLRS